MVAGCISWVSSTPNSLMSIDEIFLCCDRDDRFYTLNYTNHKENENGT